MQHQKQNFANSTPSSDSRKQNKRVRWGTSDEFIKSISDRRWENVRRWKVRRGMNWIPVFEETSEAKRDELQDSLQHKGAGEEIITVLESDLQRLGGKETYRRRGSQRDRGKENKRGV